MTEGTRVSQLAENLAKFIEEYMEFKTSTTAFQISTAAFQTRVVEFQTCTQTTLEEILKRVSPVVQPNKDQELIQGGASGHSNKSPIYVEPIGETYSSPVLEGGGILAKPVQLEFPKFERADSIDWVLKAPQFFSYGQIPDTQKVPISAFHMEGRALQWYNWLMELAPVTN
jgi:hypothetical protein